MEPNRKIRSQMITKVVSNSKFTQSQRTFMATETQLDLTEKALLYEETLKSNPSGNEENIQCIIYEHYILVKSTTVQTWQAEVATKCYVMLRYVTLCCVTLHCVTLRCVTLFPTSYIAMYVTLVRSLHKSTSYFQVKISLLNTTGHVERSHGSKSYVWIIHPSTPTSSIPFRISADWR